MALWESFLPAKIKNHLVAGTGEFVGTFMFLFMSFSVVQIASSRVQYAREAEVAPAGGSDPATILYIAMGFGMSLAVNVWIFFRVSGGMFNPAVTVALVLGCGMPIPRAAICILAQILGSIAAAGVAEAILPGTLAVGTNVGNGITVVQGLFIEMFLTAQLIITIFMLAVEKTKATFLAPLGIGGALFVGHLVGIFYTGASLNPVRSFGPAVVAHHFNSDHWIYWVGPLLGALVAAGFYRLLKFLQYEAANPDQDIDLSCYAREDDSIEGKSQTRTNWSRSKESDVEFGSSLPPKSPVVARTQSDDNVLE